MIGRRLLSLLGGLALLCQSSYAFNAIDWSAIDNDLNMLEWNLEQLKTDNERLESAFDEQALYSTNLSIQLADCEKRLEASGRTMRLWRGCCIITTLSSLVLLGVLIMR